GLLGGRGRLVDAAPAAGTAPAGLGEGRREGELRPADRDDVGRGGGVLGREPGVAGGDEEAYAGLREVAVVGRLTAELRCAPAVGHVLGEAGGGVLGGEEVGE